MTQTLSLLMLSKSCDVSDLSKFESINTLNGVKIHQNFENSVQLPGVYAPSTKLIIIFRSVETF
jgi:hypothetical protein